MTTDSNGSTAAVFEETPIGWEAHPKGIEATVHQIATGLQNTEGYLALASHMSQVAPYELPQVVAQIPPPPWMYLYQLEKLYQLMVRAKQ